MHVDVEEFPARHGSKVAHRDGFRPGIRVVEVDVLGGPVDGEFAGLSDVLDVLSNLGNGEKLRFGGGNLR